MVDESSNTVKRITRLVRLCEKGGISATELASAVLEALVIDQGYELLGQVVETLPCNAVEELEAMFNKLEESHFDRRIFLLRSDPMEHEEKLRFDQMMQARLKRLTECFFKLRDGPDGLPGSRPTNSQ